MRKIKKPKPKIKKKKIFKELEKRIAEQANMFSRIPEQCDLCKKEFDKNDREMVQSWKVTVFEKEKRVRLCCPECWGKLTEAVEQA